MEGKVWISWPKILYLLLICNQDEHIDHEIYNLLALAISLFLRFAWQVYHLGSTVIAPPLVLGYCKCKEPQSQLPVNKQERKLSP